MMIGEGRRDLEAISPPWPPFLIKRLLPASEAFGSDDSPAEEEFDHAISPPVDAFSCDEFRMFEFKVRRCARGRSHDWTECPYAHPGEKARRRDPRKYNYSGATCPDFRKGSCKRGDACEFAHGVFECWLHPTRYRTQPCKDGEGCRRRVCFFAHRAEELRVLSPPLQPQSPTTPDSTGLPFSAPESPSVNEVVASLRKLRLSKSGSWGLSSPPGFNLSPPLALFDGWDALPERVESGRGLRAKMYEKLSKENSLDRVEPEAESDGHGTAKPDLEWVSDLVE